MSFQRIATVWGASGPTFTQFYSGKRFGTRQLWEGCLRSAVHMRLAAPSFSRGILGGCEPCTSQGTRDCLPCLCAHNRHTNDMCNTKRVLHSQCTRCGCAVRFKPDWHRAMVTMSVAQKQSWGSEHQKWAANCCIWVEIPILWSRGKYVRCSPVYSTGHMATNAGLLKPGSDVVY